MPEPRKKMHCKGTLPGTNLKCRAELCEMDDVKIYLQLESRRELEIRPKLKRGFGIVCAHCGYENFWEGNGN